MIDASVTVSWAFEDEVHPLPSLALARIRSDEAHVPSLWWYEIRNALIINERRGRLTEADTAQFLRSLSRLPIMIDQPQSEAEILALARRHRLTVYDAAYLELAQRRNISLATLDKDLELAARTDGIPLFEAGPT